MTNERRGDKVGQANAYNLSGASGGASGGNIFFGRGALDTRHLDPAHNWGLPITYGPPMPAVGPSDGARYEDVNTGDVWTFKVATDAHGVKTWTADRIPGRPTAVEHSVRGVANVNTRDTWTFATVPLTTLPTDWREFRVMGLITRNSNQLYHLVFKLQDHTGGEIFPGAGLNVGAMAGWYGNSAHINYLGTDAIQDHVMPITRDALTNKFGPTGLAASLFRPVKIDMRVVRFGKTNTGINLRAYYHEYTNYETVTENQWLYRGQPDIGHLLLGGNTRVHGGESEMTFVGKLDFVR